MLQELEILKEKNINIESLNLYNKYLTSCYVKNKTTKDTTYKSYLSSMKLFLIFLRDYYDNIFILDDELIKTRNFVDTWEHFISICQDAGNNNQTIRNKRVGISTFLDWCERRDIIMANPFRKIEQIKITPEDKVRKSYFLTPQQIWEINYIMNTETTKYSIQDRLIFNLFLDSAVRISAGHNLKLSQLDLNNNCFVGVRHKEGYIKPVFFFEKTKEILLEWLKQREELNIQSDWLFITKYGGSYKQMSKGTIRDKVKKIGKIVGIDNYYPHSIRKTIINIIAQSGSLEEASALALHKSTRVTSEHYIDSQKGIEIHSKIGAIRKMANI